MGGTHSVHHVVRPDGAQRVLDDDAVAPPVAHLRDRHPLVVHVGELAGVDQPARVHDRHGGGRIGAPTVRRPVGRRREQITAGNPGNRHPRGAGHVVCVDVDVGIETELTVTLCEQVRPRRVRLDREAVERRRGIAGTCRRSDLEGDRIDDGHHGRRGFGSCQVAGTAFVHLGREHVDAAVGTQLGAERPVPTHERNRVRREQPRLRVGRRPADQGGETRALLHHPDVVDQACAARRKAHLGVLERPQHPTVGQRRGSLVVGADDTAGLRHEQAVEIRWGRPGQTDRWPGGGRHGRRSRHRRRDRGRRRDQHDDERHHEPTASAGDASTRGGRAIHTTVSRAVAPEGTSTPAGSRHSRRMSGLRTRGPRRGADTPAV